MGSEARSCARRSSRGTGIHSAGFDAIATGFVHAIYVQRVAAKQGTEPMLVDSISAPSKSVDYRNRLYLVGKPNTLLLQKSRFT